MELFLLNIKYVQLDTTPLVIKQRSYATKIANVFIVCDWDNRPKNLLRNFSLKNCLFGATNVVKDNDKEKYMYSSYEIAFDGKGSWSFNYEFARDVVVFRVDNSSPSHTDNLRASYIDLLFSVTRGHVNFV